VALHLPSHAYPNQDGAGGADHDPAPSRKSSVSRTSVHTSVETMPSPKGVEAVEMTLKVRSGWVCGIGCGLWVLDSADCSQNNTLRRRKEFMFSFHSHLIAVVSYAINLW